MKTLTQKELRARWRYDDQAMPSIKTVRRDIKRFGLKPCRFRGLQPFFDVRDVEKMEARREEAKLAALGYGYDARTDGQIISVRKAKAIARRGRK